MYINEQESPSSSTGEILELYTWLFFLVENIGQMS